MKTKYFSWDTISQDIKFLYHKPFKTSEKISPQQQNKTKQQQQKTKQHKQTIFGRLSRDYTVPYPVPGVTFCEKQVHHEKVITQELSDQSRLR